MTSNFDEYSQSEETPNALKRDRFELLSAYLDGEVTAPERRQVEAWLQSDPKMQALYARMLKMQQGIRRLPTPAPSQPVEQTVQQVVSRIERKPKRVAFLSGGMAIAALFVGAVFSVVPKGEFFPQVATAPYSQQQVSDEGLMIALDQPLYEMPNKSRTSPNSPSPRAFE
jgi:anti-sigma factor RsiW